MREDSGKNPPEPHILPAQPGREPLPRSNGPALPPAAERIAAGPAGVRAATPAAPDPGAGRDKDKKPPEPKDAFREIVETVVFVVVLVLLLKAFMAEAFVIPTGSMAPTLLGYHKVITCPECGVRFPLNMSKEMDVQDSNRQPITGCRCPNCFLHIDQMNSEEFRRQ
jgi:signal peptidase I